MKRRDYVIAILSALGWLGAALWLVHYGVR